MYAFGLCTLLGFPLFFSSGRSFMLLLCFILFTSLCYFVVLGPITGAIYYTGCLLLMLLFVLRFALRVASFFTLFYFVFILSVLVLLTLGFTCPECPSQAQLIRAELSSNGSSESRSESFSKLSSHQIPRCLDIEGTTTAKGLYAKLFYVLTHYAFRGVSAQCVLHALSTPLRPRGRIGVFHRREGPPRQPLSGIPFFRHQPFGLSHLRGVSSRRGPPPADPRFLWVRSPFFSLYVILLVAAYLREV